MKELKITDSAAIQAYNNADCKGKDLLTNLFGKEVFNQKITDRVKTFEDACNVLGIRPCNVLPPIGFEDHTIAHIKLTIIAKALNEGWQPNWNNSREAKYYPWFNMGNGFSLYYFDCNYRYSYVGSRLCFKSSELAMYAGKQFLDLYKTYMTI